MARTGYGINVHSVTATGSNDNSKQVSVNAWNADHVKSEAGMLGFTKQSATISGNAIAVTGTLIEIQADGTLNTITPTDANEFDLIYLIAKSTATSAFTICRRLVTTFRASFTEMLVWFSFVYALTFVWGLCWSGRENRNIGTEKN